MPDEFVIPAEVQVKPGNGYDPDIFVFTATKKKAGHFFFVKQNHAAWLGRVLDALEAGETVTVDLIKKDFKTVAGRKYFRTQKVAK